MQLKYTVFPAINDYGQKVLKVYRAAHFLSIPVGLFPLRWHKLYTGYTMSYSECGRDSMDDFDFTFNDINEALEFINKEIKSSFFTTLIEIDPKCASYLDLSEQRTQYAK